jgi:hypothetical protein
LGTPLYFEGGGAGSGKCKNKPTAMRREPATNVTSLSVIPSEVAESTDLREAMLCSLATGENYQTKPNRRGELWSFQNRGGGNRRRWRLGCTPTRSARLSRNPGATTAPIGLPRGKRREGAERKSQKRPRRSSSSPSQKRKNKATASIASSGPERFAKDLEQQLDFAKLQKQTHWRQENE